MSRPLIRGVRLVLLADGRRRPVHGRASGREAYVPLGSSVDSVRRGSAADPRSWPAAMASMRFSISRCSSAMRLRWSSGRFAWEPPDGLVQSRRWTPGGL